MLASFEEIKHNAHLLAGIAQLVEQLTCNQKVPSSTLGTGTKYKIERNRTITLYFFLKQLSHLLLCFSIKMNVYEFPDI